MCHSLSMATVLTFDVALPITEFENIDQRYGDRVSQVNMPFNFQYGHHGEGFTRTSAIDYGPLVPVNADPALRTTGFGDLTNVLIKDNDSAPTLRITFNAILHSETVLLHGWDMAALSSAFTSDPVINSVRVVGPGTNGTQWFSATNVSISRTTHTRFEFPQPIEDFQLILEIDLANLVIERRNRHRQHRLFSKPRANDRHDVANCRDCSAVDNSAAQNVR